MVSAVQVVFLIDINQFIQIHSNSAVYEAYKSKISLCCLRLLTEFGALTDNGNDKVRWSFKFYNSRVFKPDTTRKIFVDFNKKSFDDLNKEIENAVKKIKQSNGSDRKATLRTRKNSNFNSELQSNNIHLDKEGTKPGSFVQDTNDEPLYSHSFILKKSLQEILLDYNWDRPDISSPVKLSKPNLKATRKNNYKNIQPSLDTIKDLNFVIAYTNVPTNLQELSEFIGQPKNNEKCKLGPSVFVSEIFDPATFNGFADDKKLRFHVINASQSIIDASLRNGMQTDLNKLLGGIHEINNLVQEKKFITSSFQDVKKNGLCQKHKNLFSDNLEKFYFPSNGSELSIYSNHWWNKKRISSRSRVSQRGPSLEWVDKEGIHFIKIPLNVFSVHVSTSKQWDTISVCGAVRGNVMSILANGIQSCDIFVCHSADAKFSTILSILQEQNMILLSTFQYGGLVGIAPWIGGIGCLVVYSVSGAASPICNTEETETLYNDVMAAAIKKTLNKAPRVNYKTTYEGAKIIQPQMLKPWFPSTSMNISALPKRTNTRGKYQLALLERLQKKYRPQMPRPLSGSHLPPQVLIDVTQPQAAAAVPNAVPVTNGKPNISRAQQLVKKSKIVTAQMKVKEQQAEEKVQQKKIEAASHRAQKSLAYATQTLKNISDPQDKDELASMLMSLRDSPQKDASNEIDLYTKAQTIINLALMNLKSNSQSHSIEVELRDVLSRGVLMSAQGVSSNYEESFHLHHYKLQCLLHLEVLWVLGYSSNGLADCSDRSVERGDLKDQFVQQVLNILRKVSLRHGPSHSAEFLQQSVLPNYQEFLGETLVEIYEEMNVPLPESLLMFVDDEQFVRSVRPASVKSHFSPTRLQSNGPQSDDLNTLINKEGTNKPRPLLRREASNRQIIVPHVKRANRKVATVKKKTPKKVGSSVCRSLFDKTNKSATKLKKYNTISSFGNSFKQKTPSKGNLKSSRFGGAKRKRSSSTLLDSVTKESITPSSKKFKVLAPETPAYAEKTTLGNKRRLAKSTGCTSITETPDGKGLSSSTEESKKTNLTRRTSFYSGAQSRNFEKGKKQLISSHITGTLTRRNSLPSKASGFSQLFFSESTKDKDRKDVSECRKLDFGPNIDGSSEEDFHSMDENVSQGSSEPDIQTPLNKAKRILSLASPAKFVTKDALKRTQSLKEVTSSEVISKTPLKIKENLIESSTTPSKRVQFNFTPSKPTVSAIESTKTPRSILKTPCKTPNKTPSKTPLKQSASKFVNKRLIGQFSKMDYQQQRPSVSSLSKRREQFRFDGDSSCQLLDENLSAKTLSPMEMLIRAPILTPSKSQKRLNFKSSPFKSPLKSLSSKQLTKGLSSKPISDQNDLIKSNPEYLLIDEDFKSDHSMEIEIVSPFKSFPKPNISEEVLVDETIQQDLGTSTDKNIGSSISYLEPPADFVNAIPSSSYIPVDTSSVESEPDLIDSDAKPEDVNCFLNFGVEKPDNSYFIDSYESSYKTLRSTDENIKVQNEIDALYLFPKGPSQKSVGFTSPKQTESLTPKLKWNDASNLEISLVTDDGSLSFVNETAEFPSSIYNATSIFCSDNESFIEVMSDKSDGSLSPEIPLDSSVKKFVELCKKEAVEKARRNESAIQNVCEFLGFNNDDEVFNFECSQSNIFTSEDSDIEIDVISTPETQKLSDQHYIINENYAAPFNNLSESYPSRKSHMDEISENCNYVSEITEGKIGDCMGSSSEYFQLTPYKDADDMKVLESQAMMNYLAHNKSISKKNDESTTNTNMNSQQSSATAIKSNNKSTSDTLPIRATKMIILSTPEVIKYEKEKLALAYNDLGEDNECHQSKSRNKGPKKGKKSKKTLSIISDVDETNESFSPNKNEIEVHCTDISSIENDSLSNTKSDNSLIFFKSKSSSSDNIFKKYDDKDLMCQTEKLDSKNCDEKQVVLSPRSSPCQILSSQNGSEFGKSETNLEFGFDISDTEELCNNEDFDSEYRNILTKNKLVEDELIDEEESIINDKHASEVRKNCKKEFKLDEKMTEDYFLGVDKLPEKHEERDEIKGEIEKIKKSIAAMVAKSNLGPECLNQTEAHQEKSEHYLSKNCKNKPTIIDNECKEQSKSVSVVTETNLQDTNPNVSTYPMNRYWPPNDDITIVKDESAIDELEPRVPSFRKSKRRLSTNLLKTPEVKKLKQIHKRSTPSRAAKCNMNYNEDHILTMDMIYRESSPKSRKSSVISKRNINFTPDKTNIKEISASNSLKIHIPLPCINKLPSHQETTIMSPKRQTKDVDNLLGTPVIGNRLANATKERNTPTRAAKLHISYAECDDYLTLDKSFDDLEDIIFPESSKPKKKKKKKRDTEVSSNASSSKELSSETTHSSTCLNVDPCTLEPTVPAIPSDEIFRSPQSTVLKTKSSSKRAKQCREITNKYDPLRSLMGCTPISNSSEVSTIPSSRNSPWKNYERTKNGSEKKENIYKIDKDLERNKHWDEMGDESFRTLNTPSTTASSSCRNRLSESSFEICTPKKKIEFLSDSDVDKGTKDCKPEPILLRIRRKKKNRSKHKS